MYCLQILPFDTYAKKATNSAVIIRDNLDKLIIEGAGSTAYHTGFELLDTNLEKNIYSMLAGSLTYIDEIDTKNSPTSAAKKLEEALIKLDGDNKSILKLQGSPSMLDMKMDDTAITLLKPFEGKKNIKVTKPKKPKKTKKKPIKNKAKVKAKKAPMSIAAVAVRKINLSKAKSQRRKKGGGGTSFNPLQIVALINKELPDTVRANMGNPALTNQTGRFAESVRATDMMMTPQGFPSVGYTYQRDPYGTFEQDADYDPRTLIDRSMREIAAQYAIGRFYTRRV